MLLRGPPADGSRSNHAMELLDLGVPTTTRGSLAGDDKPGAVRAP
jgi:hypothetical protein